ncbi:MAG: hypothetical protein MJK14_01425 [Rivularia sp. ALOHA_DT_140]|nr:hypothetical protein [Rivularia sp. ALOHA_DT_140]
MAPIALSGFFLGVNSQSGFMQLSAIFCILFTVLFALYKRIKLKINKHRILVVYELFRFDWQFYRHKFKSGTYKLELLYSNLVKVGANPKLSMWSGSKFNIHKYGDFTLEELEWLAQEISDYLDIPIERF